MRCGAARRLPQQIGADLGSAFWDHHSRKKLQCSMTSENTLWLRSVALARKMPRRVASPQQVSSAKSRWFVELMQPREVGKLAA